MYKLIVSDMDGTLLNSSKVINYENIKAIKMAQDAGIEFAIATGRPYTMVKDFLVEHDLRCAVIGCNGAQIVDKYGKLIKAHYLDFDTMMNLICLVEKENFIYSILLDSRLYTQLPRHSIRTLGKLATKGYSKSGNIISSTVGFLKFILRNIKINENLHKYVLREKPNVYKIDVMAAELNSIDRLKEKLQPFTDIYITSSYRNNIEICTSGVSKGNAVLEFAESLGVKPEEIVSFGDNYNDLSMIEVAGVGVAMGNAEEEVKNAADFITLTNNQSGVAYGINKLVFEDSLDKAYIR